jgi:hypothetical protein
VEIMQNYLTQANFDSNILLTPGKTFSLDDLAKILVNTNDKLNMIYNKYFYGFEKEGKSLYF